MKNLGENFNLFYGKCLKKERMSGEMESTVYNHCRHGRRSVK